MGREKAKQLQKEEGWNTKASIEEYRCKECETLISYDEREFYFKINRCTYCHYTLSKDD